MADGDARDRWASDRRNVGQPPAPDSQRRADPRPAHAREPGAADAPLRRGSPGTIGATGAPRPVAPTRPLRPTTPATGRAMYGPQRSGERTEDLADERGYQRGGDLPMAQAPQRRLAARPRAGWRRFTPILLGLVAGIALVAVALGALIIFTPRVASPQAPSATTQQLCADLTTQRYADAYALLSPRLQAQGSEAQFVASQRELDALQGDVTTCSAAIVNVAGASASAALQVTRAHAKAASAAITLTVVGSAWRVDAYDTAVI